MRGVILAGGKGTRLSPQTQIHNKHLLPVYSDQGAIPMIWYPLNTLVNSGCKEVLIISSQEHCGDIIEFLGDGRRFGIDLTYRVQDHSDPTRPVGIASALKLIQAWNPNEPFGVILGDNFYSDSFKAEFDSFEMLYKINVSDNVFNNKAQIFLKAVHDPERFGVAFLDENGEIAEIVEKPKEPISNLAVTGLYLYTPRVYDILPLLKPSKRGELEVSDINDEYVKNDNINYRLINGYWGDMGTPQSMLDTQRFINQTNFKVNFK